MADVKPVSNRTAVAATTLVAVLLTSNIATQFAVVRELQAVARSTEGTAIHASNINAKTHDGRWEYDVVWVEDSEWSTAGRLLGEKGWDIVSARRASNEDDKFGYEVIMRRRLP